MLHNFNWQLLVFFPAMDCGSYAPKELSYATTFVSPIISLISLTGNLIILFVVLKDPLKKMRSPFNYFLVNLTVSDLVIGAVSMPISTYVHRIEAVTGTVSDGYIKLMHGSFFVSITSSLLSMIALSVDRYLAISWAIRYRHYFSWKRCVVVSIFIWFVSFMFIIVYIMLGYIISLMIYACTTLSVGFTVMIVIYFRVYMFLRRHTLELKKNLNISSFLSKNSFQLKRLLVEKKVTRVFLLILSMFVLTYIPASAMIFLLHFCKNCNCTLRHVLRDTQFWLIPFNSCVNPIICTTRLAGFRKSVKFIFHCRSTNQKATKTHNIRMAKIKPAD